MRYMQEYARPCAGVSTPVCGRMRARVREYARQCAGVRSEIDRRITKNEVLKVVGHGNGELKIWVFISILKILFYKNNTENGEHYFILLLETLRYPSLRAHSLITIIIVTTIIIRSSTAVSAGLYSCHPSSTSTSISTSEFRSTLPFREYELISVMQLARCCQIFNTEYGVVPVNLAADGCHQVPNNNWYDHRLGASHLLHFNHKILLLLNFLGLLLAHQKCLQS